MKKICRYLLLLTILLSGTQVINLPYISFSFFQIALIIFTISFIVYIIHNRSIKKGMYIILSFLFLISSVLAYVVSINKSWAKGYLLLGIMTTVIFFAIPNLFDIDDIPILKKTLIRSQYITIPFSIYSMYMFYFSSGVPNIVKLPLGMSIQLEDSIFLRAETSHQIRLSLPYATPPVLSLVMALCIIILLCSKDIYKNIYRYFLIIVFLIILIFTSSRTGIISLILTGIVYLIKRFRTNKNVKKILQFSIFGIIIAFLLLFIFGNSVYIQKYFSRFINVNILTDRHFLVPLDGLIIWLNSLKNFFIGIGFGSSYYMMGAHTFLPPYFLNSIVTLLAERGFLGLLIVFLLFTLLHKRSRACKDDSSESQFMFYLFLCSIIAAFTYEVFNCYFVLFVMAIVLIDSKEKKDEDFGNCSNL